MIKQKIFIVNSKKYEVIEKISLLLHIFTLIIGSLTLISLIETKDKAALFTIDKILEFITIIFVGVIVFIHLFMPVLKRKIVKKHLSDFWGEKVINSVVSHPSKIDYSEKHKLGKVIDELSEKYKYLTKMTFKRKGFKIGLIIERIANVEGDKNNNFSPFLTVPTYIIVDIEEGKIEMTNKVTFLNGEKIESPRHLYFDFKNKKVTWSGQFPEVPYYGTWEWEE